MLIIAGLGNPGGKYASHRHNIGFMAADEIVRRHSFGPWRQKFNAELSEGTIDGEKVLVVKPQTHMNNSGEAVSKAMRFYKLEPADIVVIYDELDLVAGKMRMKTGGGAGGHNGIRSIDAHCGNGFRRMRLGIGHPGHKDRVTNHVLGDFAKADYEWVDPLLQAIADNVDCLVKNDDPGFMNKLAIALNGDRSDNHTEKKKKAAKNKQQSHIRQARPTSVKKVPKAGPMADMLKKLFGKDED
ncbi:MAG: aminoacyl-tRNA hydrolase [Rhizobiaceae bacterium]|nr:aminoacyl-tRNA hydrolase [Rhizobiaceae bacterium]